jgi:pimeloyl-ACP methyl ester carboxylesterase
MNKKALLIVLFFILFFWFHSAKADVYFSQPNSNGYIYFEYNPLDHSGNVFKGDDGSTHLFTTGGFTTIANFSTGLDYPIPTTSVTSYVTDIILQIKDFNQTENVNYGLEFWCSDGSTTAPTNGAYDSSYVNSSIFSGDFTTVDFKFSTPNCDLSKYQIHQLYWIIVPYQPTGQTNIQVRTQNVNSITGYGGSNDNGNILENLEYYEAQMTIKSGPYIIPQVSKTPVLIVPGIMGTELFNDSELLWADLGRIYLHAGDTDLQNHFMVKGLSLNSQGNSLQSIQAGKVIDKINMISPIPDLHFFDFLIQDIEKNGYTQDKDLFLFPYDWRLDLQKTKDLLKQKIEAIKLQTGSAKVDIVAHSMGGLLVKNYLNTYGKDSVNKLVFVGTPHLGAPKAGKVLLQGDRFGIPWLNDEIMKILGQNSPAVHELLPSPAYFSHYQGYIKPYKFLSSSPFFEYGPTQEYLNSKSPSPAVFADANGFFGQNLQDMDFSGLNVYNIAGCKTGTETGYQLAIGNSMIGGVGYSSGDGTVPLPSADYINIPAQNKFYVKNADHSSLPSMDGARDLITGILKDQITLFSNVSNSSAFCQFKGKTLSWHSPVEVHIYLNGQHTGPVENGGIEYGIPGVSYDIIGHNKYIFLPTDEGQTYSVQATGLETGAFDLQISDVNDNGIGNTFVYNDIPVSTGTPVSFSVADNSQDNQIQVNNQPQTDSARLVGNQAEDLVPPQTVAALAGTLGSNGWYKSNVQVSLTATDDSSGILITKYSVDNGVWQNYAAPFIITDEGTHTIKYYSVDNAGNNEEAQSLDIKADKTPPEFTAQFKPVNKDFEILATDNLDFNPAKTCTTSQCTATDQAGNTSILIFQKQNLPLNIKNLILKSISYKGKSSNFNPNLFTIAYSLSSGNVADLNQTELIKNQQILNITYNQKKNQSTVTDLTKGSKPVITTSPGVKILQTLTNNSKIKINVK